jgi:hypothetical protein
VSKLFLYADSESREILTDTSQKILLVGSDFGYGNFGDVLQHANALQIVRRQSRFRTVSVFSTEVISSNDFPAWARCRYQTDAIIFVSAAPQHFVDSKPPIAAVQHMRNVTGVYLYGGGFLNTMWGDFVLDIAEFFLNRFPNARYWISGQQVSEFFEQRVAQHIARHTPVVFGVRDMRSFRVLAKTGVEPSFSFDDATEPLQALGRRLLRKSDKNAFVHCNASSYTGNESSLKKLAEELSAVDNILHGKAILLQAYRDRRECIVDTRETVKSLEIDFPFRDYQLLELPAFCYQDENPRAWVPVEGAMGYSCSYHVALWLQLAGIPCYLRRSNPYYDEKAEALGIAQSLPEFLDGPALTDHRSSLEQREIWLRQLECHMADTPKVGNEVRLEPPIEGEQGYIFHYKGHPTTESQLQWWKNRALLLESEFETSRAELISEIDLLNRQFDELNARVRELSDEAHQQRQRAEQSSAICKQMSQSFSWRLTKPLRAASSFLRSPTFYK